MDHIPAWKRIAIKSQSPEQTPDETALNVTTHLATANLSKREKRRIIRGEPEGGKAKKAANPNKKQKKDKLPREERNLHKEEVLKDQLRYLIDFYREKVGKLPATVYEHKPVRAQLGDPQVEDAEEASADAGVVSVWKFSKQKQNWLLKHILDDVQIPACYDDLLYSYFKDLKGGARAGLEQACRELLDRNEKAVAAEAARVEAAADQEKETAEEDQDAKPPAEATPATAETMVPPSAHQVERAKSLIAHLEQAAKDEQS
ncbi:RNA-binding ribosome assembly factor RBP95 [Lachancea thermotolerans CBS 6340]|uniref:KLTH0H13706p n=1 Tax=Lachancea thermotolerans (strain ATCC 56472 / CBS 6340 / NRRL Y-8284) TaxID=559295 RepID=C5E3H9_LACTC|nr:KLTH0H13706p [Lachancea thermotolerans CBS 6340]CAR30590.1 KLTH0H13706p [Lachancea thermotolerans CBS 6340]